MPPSNVVLAPFQEEGVAFLEQYQRSILADEMGLGKTIQIGEVLRRNWGEIKTCLVIGRGSLVRQWQAEFLEKFFIDLANGVGTDADALVMCQQWSYVYINYAKLRVPRFMQALRPREWDCIVVDEAHNVKGRNSAAVQGLKDLARKAKRLYFLTGTPEPNGDPTEIWSWLNCIDPKTYSSYWRYAEEHCEVEQWGNRRMVTKVKDPAKTASSLRHVLLRRREQDVRGQLPDALYTKVPHDLTQRQRGIYSQMKKEWLISLENPSLLTGSRSVEAQNTAHHFALLRKVAASPRLVGDHEDGGKIGVIRDLFQEAVDAGRKVVVFTYHRALAELVHERLSEWGYPGGLLYGGVEGEVQQQLVDDFQRGQSVRLVGTIDMLAEGWNLQAGSVGIFAQLSYVPAKNAQAVGRLLRMGQERNVLIYSLIARSTVEEYVWHLVRRKGESVTELEVARAYLRQLREEEGHGTRSEPVAAGC